MPELKIEPLRPEELDDFIRVFWAAFEPIEADMIMPQTYPLGLQRDLLDHSRNRMLRETDGKLGDFCFCAKDSRTEEIAAVSWWAVTEHPPQTKEDIEAAWQKARQARNHSDPVQGMNVALGEAFLRTAIYCEYETMQGKPYVSLRILATHPRHQKKGAGSMLLQHGLSGFADRLRLPVYLDAGTFGKPLYEKYGFSVSGEFPFDGRQYGGRSEGKHWCMVRPAVS